MDGQILHSLQATSFQWQIMCVVLFQRPGFKGMQLVTLTSFCRFFNIKFSPGCSFWTSGMTCRYMRRTSENCNEWWSWWNTTQFGRAPRADRPLLRFCFSTAPQKQSWRQRDMNGLFCSFSLSNKLPTTNRSRCTFSVAGLQRHADCLSGFTLSAVENQALPAIPDERLIWLVGKKL